MHLRSEDSGTFMIPQTSAVADILDIGRTNICRMIYKLVKLGILEVADANFSMARGVGKKYRLLMTVNECLASQSDTGSR